MKKRNNLIKSLYSNDVIGAGSYGIVYNNYDGTATKVIRATTTSPDVIIKIKELNLDNFYKIIDVITSENHLGNKYLKAYKMNLIESDDKLLIKSNMEFFINSINSLLNDFKILSDNHIYANDLHGDNIIVTNKGIKIIDCDLYKYIPDFPIDYLYKNNILMLKDAICDLLCDEVSYVSLFRLLKKKRLQRLFEENSFDEIYHELDNYENILEYIKK